MKAALPVLGCFVLYALGYLWYSRFLARRVFGLRRDVKTPAHTLSDGVDYVPSIAGYCSVITTPRSRDWHQCWGPRWR